MKKIIGIVNRRLDAGKKETAFAWHGKPLSQEKIDRAKKRFESAAKLHQCDSNGRH